MIKIDEKKLAGLKTGSQHLAETYGEKGTPSREEFEAKANKYAKEQAVPDMEHSLLGAGEKVAEDDLNAREAYYKYLEEKYK